MKCPGQDSQYWKPGAIFETKCPKCGAEVEFFKDDSMRRCAKCGHKFLKSHSEVLWQYRGVEGRLYLGNPPRTCRRGKGFSYQRSRNRGFSEP